MQKGSGVHWAGLGVFIDQDDAWTSLGHEPGGPVDCGAQQAHLAPLLRSHEACPSACVRVCARAHRARPHAYYAPIVLGLIIQPKVYMLGQKVSLQRSFIICGAVEWDKVTTPALSGPSRRWIPSALRARAV